MTPTTNVVDLFHGDKILSLDEAKAAGVWGIIHKASQGAAMVDPMYAKRRQWIKETGGILFGAYHFLTGSDPRVQAAHFISAAKPDNQTLMALDFEQSNATPTLRQARQFVEAVEQTLGRKIVIYSGNLIKECLGAAGDISFWGERRLWLAQYDPRPTHVPACWPKGPWLWQFSEKGSVPGIPGAGGKVDCNHYAGTREQLAAEWAT